MIWDDLARKIGAQRTTREYDMAKMAYQEGYLEALTMFAVWHDGEQLVGCGIKTLKQAKEEFLKDMK